MKLIKIIASAMVVALVIKKFRKSKQSLVSPYNPPVESLKPVLDTTV